MIHRMLLIVLTLGVLLTGSGLAQDPDGGMEPLRLKKKKKPDNPMEEPMKDKAPPDKGPTVKEPANKEQPKEPAVVDPVTPEENEKELLERIGRNMRQVEDRLINKELDEATFQLEDDIIKDLDALIKKSEDDQNSGGGGGGENNQDMESGEQGMNQPQGGQGQPGGGMAKRNSSRNKQSGGGSSKQQKGNQGGQQARNQPGSGGMAKNQPSGQGMNQPMGQGMGQNQPMPQGMGQNQPMGQGMSPGNGNNPGGGGQNDPNNPPDRNADLYKDVWGHLPETIRAQMNAYSGREEYMSKHRDLIKQYYRTLAAQGRNNRD
jgi:hypothetical protein